MAVGAESLGDQASAFTVDRLALAPTGQTRASATSLMLLKVLRREFMPALAVSETGVKVLFVPDGVVRIGTTGAPAQVFKPVVGGVVVYVKGLHAIWAWTNKRLQN